jgi:hypothetical protein
LAWGEAQFKPKSYEKQPEHAERWPSCRLGGADRDALCPTWQGEFALEHTTAPVKLTTNWRSAHFGKHTPQSRMN